MVGFWLCVLLWGTGNLEARARRVQPSSIKVLLPLGLEERVEIHLGQLLPQLSKKVAICSSVTLTS